jgi:hypothetical protein
MTRYKKKQTTVSMVDKYKQVMDGKGVIMSWDAYPDPGGTGISRRER